MTLATDTTDLIAWIGCITGCIGGLTGMISLVVTLIEKWKSRYRLKVGFLDNDNVFFPAITQKKYASEYQATLHIVLRNKSLSPLTIHDAYLMVDGKCTYFEEYSGDDIRIPPSKSLTKPLDISDLPRFMTPEKQQVIPMKRQFIVPIRLETFDAFEGIGFVPYFPCKSRRPKVTLILKTASRKEHKIQVNIKEFNMKEFEY